MRDYGPLELRRRDSESVLIRTASLGAMNHTVAIVVGDTGLVERESDPSATSPVWVNARLFAAAPDLLEACEEILRCQREGTFGVDGVKGMVLAQMAVAKARGVK